MSKTTSYKSNEVLVTNKQKKVAHGIPVGVTKTLSAKWQVPTDFLDVAFVVESSIQISPPRNSKMSCSRSFSVGMHPMSRSW